MITPEFLLTSLIVVLIPGTGVIYTVSTSLFFGWRAGIAAAIGCTAGIIPHLLASVCGLAAILHTSAVVFQGIKFVGVAYLLYLAWGMWRETGTLRLEASGGTRSVRRIVVRGLLINILNPKLSIFFLAFLPQFISPAARDPLPQMLTLSALFMAMTLVIFVIYGLTAHSVRRQVVDSPKVMTRVQRTFAAIFTLLGIKLALADR